MHNLSITRRRPVATRSSDWYGNSMLDMRNIHTTKPKTTFLVTQQIQSSLPSNVLDPCWCCNWNMLGKSHSGLISRRLSFIGFEAFDANEGQTVCLYPSKDYFPQGQSISKAQDPICSSLARWYVEEDASCKTAVWKLAIFSANFLANFSVALLKPSLLSFYFFPPYMQMLTLFARWWIFIYTSIGAKYKYRDSQC